MSDFHYRANQLSRSILETVVYFDLFAYPLTSLEIWKNLGVKVPYQQMVSALQESQWLTQRVECQDGVWGLKGRRSERAVRYRVSKHKLNIAKKFGKWLRLVPGVVSIYACNTLGFLGSRSESDIDLFIVVRKGRIWTVRFFAVLLAKFFFRRPTGAHTKDALCLSFFATEGANLQKLALPGGDVYYEYWLKNLLPLFERRQKKLSFVRRVCTKLSFERLIERALRMVQLYMMPAHLKAMANKGTGVVLSDAFLKFHDHDRREYYRTEFAKRLAATVA